MKKINFKKIAKKVIDEESAAINNEKVRNIEN